MPIGHYVRNYFPPGAVGGIPGAAAVGGIPGAAAVGGIPGATAGPVGFLGSVPIPKAFNPPLIQPDKPPSGAAVGGIPGVSSADTDIIRFGIKNKEVIINADEKHVIFFINPPLLVKNKNVY